MPIPPPPGPKRVGRAIPDNVEQPSSDRRTSSNRRRLLGQSNESCLRDILRQVRVVDESYGGRVNPAGVTPHKLGECGFGRGLDVLI